MVNRNLAHGQQGTWLRRSIAVLTASLLTVGAFASDASAGKIDKTKKNQEPTATQLDAELRASSDGLGSMYSVVDQIGARALWERGITGQGVNVAIIDTGVADVDALSGSDKVVAMVDLSAEAGVPEARFADTYGHGTHMAGIIAGRQPGADPALAAAHPEWFLGVAPDAGIVSVKVADNTGVVDITQVIAGVDWVVDHAEELDIRVLNLSYSSGSFLGYEVDPLAFAVERAWQAGIVVVVAAGNDGKQAHQLASPANDPFVIAVAAAEAVSWKEPQRAKFKIPHWATSGDKSRAPDISAPGAHIESLRAPLSRIDIEHPEGYVSEQLFRGSGSSQAAAVVAGSVALLLEARPELTPDQVKKMLDRRASKVSPSDKIYSGAGVIRIDHVVDGSVPSRVQKWATSDGSGSIEEARGGQNVIYNGVVLSGEVTVLDAPWEGAHWSGTRWSNGVWDGTRWSSGEWMGTRWSDASWSGAHWSGTSWSGTSWTGAHWSGTSWSGTSWSGTSWSGTSWSGTSWSRAAWGGARWSSAGWN